MSNFIIRIYRQERNKPRHLVGTIEHVETGHKRAFKQMQEVWAFLAEDKEIGMGKRLKAGPGKTEE